MIAADTPQVAADVPPAGGRLDETHRHPTGRGVSAAAGRRVVAGHRGATVRGGGPVLAAPFALDTPLSQRNRRLGVLAVLGWLGEQPGDSWQQRWRASGAEDQPDWRRLVGTDRAAPLPHLTPGLQVLICADVIRPSLDWLLRFIPARHNLAAEMARTRDRAAFAELTALCQGRIGLQSQQQALINVAIIMAVKGGTSRRYGSATAWNCSPPPRAPVPPTTATPTARCFISCCARTATSAQTRPPRSKCSPAVVNPTASS